MTKQLQVILALKSLVAAALPAAQVVGFDQDTTKPSRIGPGGCVIGHPGDPGEPDMDLSPLTWNYSHHLFLEVIGPNGEGGVTLDNMLVMLGAAIAADPFLGGLCDFMAAEAPERMDRSSDNLASTNWATVPVVAEYSTTNPLG
jgi:hypothetical protein